MEAFYQRVFKNFHRERRPREQKPQGTGHAVGLLKEYTGMSWEELARALGMLPSTVTSISRRSSKLSIPICRACRRVAYIHNLPVLTKWFDELFLRMVRTQRRVRADTRPEDRKWYDEIR